MKVAFYLGSFNPFHNGHLNVIKTAFERDKMNKVVIVPTMQNPWKFNKILDLYSRSSMITMSVSDYVAEGHNVIVDYTERQLEPPYYSYNTLEQLKKKYKGHDLYFLCGEDTMNDIPNWMNGDKILKEWDFLVVNRPEGSLSSTKIREMIKEGQDISPYVSKKVLKHITRYYCFGENNLYNSL